MLAHPPRSFKNLHVEGNYNTNGWGERLEGVKRVVEEGEGLGKRRDRRWREDEEWRGDKAMQAYSYFYSTTITKASTVMASMHAKSHCTPK